MHFIAPTFELRRHQRAGLMFLETELGLGMDLRTNCANAGWLDGTTSAPSSASAVSWSVEAKFGPSEDGFCRICGPIAIAMGLISIVGRRRFCRLRELEERTSAHAAEQVAVKLHLRHEAQEGVKALHTAILEGPEAASSYVTTGASLAP